MSPSRWEQRRDLGRRHWVLIDRRIGGWEVVRRWVEITGTVTINVIVISNVMMRRLQIRHDSWGCRLRLRSMVRRNCWMKSNNSSLYPISRSNTSILSTFWQTTTNGSPIGSSNSPWLNGNNGVSPEADCTEGFSSYPRILDSPDQSETGKGDIHLDMISETTRSYSAALSPVCVDSCRNPMTTLIQSRKSRNHRQGVDQSSNITHVVCDNSVGVNVWCNNGVNSFDGLGNNDIVSRARMSMSANPIERAYHHSPRL